MKALLVIAMLAACGGGARQGVTRWPAPQLLCAGCMGETPIATHTVLRISTSWFGECFETSTGGGVFPTPGGDGEYFTGGSYACGGVPHAASVTCAGGPCRIAPSTGDRRVENEQWFSVEPLAPGTVEIRATLTPSDNGKPKLERTVVRVARPTKLAASCERLSDGTTSVGVQLLHDGGPFRAGPASFALAVNGVACTFNNRYEPSTGGLDYAFTCPLAADGPTKIVATGIDFTLEYEATCKLQA